MPQDQYLWALRFAGFIDSSFRGTANHAALRRVMLNGHKTVRSSRNVRLPALESSARWRAARQQRSPTLMCWSDWTYPPIINPHSTAPPPHPQTTASTDQTGTACCARAHRLQVFVVLASLSAPPTCARKTDEAKKSESTWSRNHRIQRCVVQDGPDPAVGQVGTVDYESPAANKL